MISSVCDICSCCTRYRNSNCKGLLDWHKLDCKKGFRSVRMTKNEKLQIIENLTKGGLSTYEIAVRLGLSKHQISCYKSMLRKAGRLPPFVDNGERARLQKERLANETIKNGICLLYIDQMLNGVGDIKSAEYVARNCDFTTGEIEKVIAECRKNGEYDKVLAEIKEYRKREVAI